MKSSPLISVIVPMYNAEKFIQKCLEHLVHQTYKNLEIIIVDDGSTDNSVAICRRYAAQDKRIKIITQKNSGPSVALNTGLNAASGEYVHFHDHDDFVNLDYFERMADCVIKTSADVLCGEVAQPDYNFPRFNAIEICTNMRDKILKTRANKFNPAWRYLYRKSFLDKTGLLFEPTIIGAQDLFFTKSAIILAHSVATVPGAIYNVVNTDTALGKNRKKTHNTEQVAAVRKVQEKFNLFLIKHNAYDLINLSEIPFQTESLKIFNKTIFRKDIFTKKIRYYLFGINIGTKHINP